jgi:hypothetical protein
MAVGTVGEAMVSRFYQSKGCGIVSTANYSGKNDDKSPRLLFESRGVIIPDIFMCMGGKRWWCEVKSYHHAPENRGKRCVVHGIKRRHYLDYLDTDKESDTRVWLHVLEIGTGDLLMLRLGTVAPWSCQCRACRVGKSDECQCGYLVNGIRDGVYWPRTAFKLAHSFNDAEMDEIRTRHDQVFGVCQECAKKRAAA